MIDFSPLTQIISKEGRDIAKKVKIKETHAFFAILVLLFLGIGFFGNPENGITGHLIFEENNETLEISLLFNSSSSLPLALKGNITSLRITGNFIGNGTGKVYLLEKKVLDSSTFQESDSNVIPVIRPYANAPEAIMPSENISGESMPENLTSVDEAIAFNDTGSSIEIIIPFDSYCLETCEINNEGNIDLIIVLENMLLNITKIEYTYIKTISENFSFSNESENETYPAQNISEDAEEDGVLDALQNETANISGTEPELNYSGNSTLNVTDIFDSNLSSNYSGNSTLNLSIIDNNATINYTNASSNETEIEINQSDFASETNGTVSEIIPGPIYPENLSIVTEAVPMPPASLSSFEKFSAKISQKGLEIIESKEAINEYSIGIDNDNYVRIKDEDLEKVDLGISDSRDSRLESKIVRLSNISGDTFVNLRSGRATNILRCAQYKDGICKKWEKTKVRFSENGRTISFTVNEQGIYAAANIISEKREYIPTSSVYYNSDCDYCESSFNCNAKNFCLINGIGETMTNFMAQADFDILELDPEFEKAEACAYAYYYSGEAVINYIKSSEESFCSNLKNANLESSLISYSYITPENGWKCIDVTEIIRDIQEKGYSNAFLNWMGQNLNKQSTPFNCYLGEEDKGSCDNYNPSGANDCRPYLKMTYR